MNTNKKVQIVMLPTEKAENSLIKCGNRSNSDFHFEYSERLMTQSYLKSIYAFSYHLYIVSNDEILDNDWYLNTTYNTIQQRHSSVFRKENLQSLTFFCKKVIATTDLNLSLCRDSEHNNSVECICNKLPKIPKDFILKYVERYNNKNIITEVEIQYTSTIRCGGNLMYKHATDNSTEENPEYIYCCDKCGKDYFNPPYNYGKTRICYEQIPVNTPSLNENNEIIITSTEERFYTKQEVIELIKDAMITGVNIRDKNQVFNEVRDNWINKNL